MSDLESALEDIARLRMQLAASSRFQGLAPGVVAITGILAFGLGLGQSALHQGSLIDWILLAAASALMIGTEAIIRARRMHRTMADRMIGSTLSRFLPAAIAGASIGATVLLGAPQYARVLPGVWQLLVGVGIFAVLTSLPRQTAIAGIYYLLAGTGSLMFSPASGPSVTWLMAVPFGFGQLLMASTLWLGSQERGHG